MSTPPSSRVWPFFTLAIGFTLLLQAPALLAKVGVLDGPPERFLAPAALGGFGPIIAAIVCSRRAPGGVKGLFARLRIKVSPAWVVLAFATYPLIWFASTAGHRLLGASDPGPWFYLPAAPQNVVAMFLVPFVEETGWRGFALPRLQERWSPLQASVLLGLAWAVWHTFMFILQGDGAATFWVSMAMIATGSLSFSWLFNRTRGSLLVAMVAHVGVHAISLNNSLPRYFGAYVAFTLGVAIAGVLLLADRKAWRGNPARDGLA